MLILVRHGQTAANASGLLQGRADLELTELGRRQAKAIAAALPAPARVVSSPLQRARATADSFGVPVEIDDSWVELHYGDYDGVPITSVEADVWTQWRTDRTFSPPGGESFEQLDQRVWAACDALAPAAAAADVVVVSHVSPIKSAVAWALGVSGAIAWRMHLDLASITRIAVAGRGASLQTFNETGHLASVARG
jgi:broad specificity phosphatase PhoE